MAKKPNTPAPGDAAPEFSELFKAARTEHRLLGGTATADGAAHKGAIAFAQRQGWKWAEALLESSRLSFAGAHEEALEILAQSPPVPESWRGLSEFVRGTALADKGDFDEAITAYRTAINAPGFDDPGSAWYNLGNVLYGKGDFDEAIAAYRRAIDTPGFDNPGAAWNNLGNVLSDKGHYDEAIAVYRKAIDTLGFDDARTASINLAGALSDKGDYDGAIAACRDAIDTPGFDDHGSAWNILGNALYAKGDDENAIAAYREAIGTPGYDQAGAAWNNLGNVLSDKGDYDEAIAAYGRAIDNPGFDNPGSAWNNLAQTYLQSGAQQLAEEAFKSALESPDRDGRNHARARLGLQLLKSGIELDALSSDDRAITGKTISEPQTDEIERRIIAAIHAAGDSQYEKYLAKPDSAREDTLSVLRGWSSAVTLLEGSRRQWRGGGYFITWRGFGIVIDPGFDFLRNFHDAGFHGREIDVVVTSHNHPDHNSDLKAIDDLKYELFKRLAGTDDASATPYVLLMDQDTDVATIFGIEVPQHHCEPIVLACGFPQAINLQEHTAKIPLKLTPFKVNHHEDVPHAMGMLIELLDDDGKPEVRIGYTADTSFFPDLPEHLRDCDILIAHISQPSIEELQDASKMKERHLGYRGTAKLIKECRPKLALVGEFWAGLTDLRIPLVKGLRQRSGVEAVLPAGLGMHVILPSLDIQCTECGKPVTFSRVKTAPPPDSFGCLAYLCPTCMIE